MSFIKHSFTYVTDSGHNHEIIKDFIKSKPDSDFCCNISANSLHKFMEEKLDTKLSNYEKCKITNMRREVKSGNKKKLAGLTYTVERVQIIPMKKILLKSGQDQNSKRKFIKENICTK